jgi:outer membrane protein assembly factor BamB
LSRRSLVEIGLLVAGLAIGAVVIVLLRDGPPTGTESPEPARKTVEIAWRYRTDGPIVSTPVVVGDRVLVGSHDNRLHCVDAATGERVWTYATDDDIEARPLVAGGRVWVGSADGKLHAVDVATGEGLWTYATGDRILGGAALWRDADGAATVYVGSYDRYLHAVDAATGEGRWTVETEHYVNGTPAVFDDRVVFGGCDGVVRIVNARTGDVVREADLGDGVHIASSVVVDRGTAFVAHVDRQVVAISIETGDTLWTYDGENDYFASPAVAGERVIVGGRDKTLRALDRVTGKPAWSAPLRDHLDATPAIAGDLVVVGAVDGRVSAVGLADGALRWEFALGGAITGSVAVTDDLLFVGCEDGTLYALRPPP